MINEQLIKRIEELENWKRDFQSSTTLPLKFEQAMVAKGFPQVRFVAGKTSVGASGNTRIAIPGATPLNSVPLITYSTPGSSIGEANIVPSTTYRGYDLLIEAVHLDEINYLVIIGVDFKDET